MDATPLLVADQVTVGFGGLLALDEVSMAVGEGEVVGVIGPNGAGKTTLFNVITGFVHPSSGTISYRGADLRRHHPHDLARLGIARTLQGIGLCAGLTVHENVMLGAEPTLRSDLASSFLGIWRSSREERAVSARAMALLEQLGAAEYAATVARLAALRGPEADRAGPRPHRRTAAAAPRRAGQRALRGGDGRAGRRSSAGLTDRMSVLLVEHHMDLVMSVCDRIVVLNFGQVIAEGTPTVIRADPDVATAYLGDPVNEEGVTPCAGGTRCLRSGTSASPSGRCRRCVRSPSRPSRAR